MICLANKKWRAIIVRMDGVESRYMLKKYGDIDTEYRALKRTFLNTKRKNNEPDVVELLDIACDDILDISDPEGIEEEQNKILDQLSLYDPVIEETTSLYEYND